MRRHTEHLAAALERAVQQVIARGLGDPRISGLISILSVRLNPDETIARIAVSVLPEDRQDLAVHGLNHAAERIRRDASDLLRIRRMPRLEFELDLSLKKQAATFAAIARASEELDANKDAPTPAPRTVAPDSEHTP